MLHTQPRTYRCFDPRDLSQALDDRATWKPTGNAILISATMLLVAQGQSCRICWEKVAALADLCEEAESPTAVETTPSRIATRKETDAMLRAALQRRDSP